MVMPLDHLNGQAPQLLEAERGTNAAVGSPVQGLVQLPVSGLKISGRWYQTCH
jgi:hypothetical protein